MENDKMQKIQFFQESLQTILMQKQAFQMELNETVAALGEVEKSKDDVYKVVGQIMIKVAKESTVEDLKRKEKILSTQLKKLEEQENKLSSEVKKLRDELIKGSKAQK
ncbi:MAG: prefoldin subunit [Nanoarchaeota archaeon]|nr:prefoldin subunit [Nanoarchaeota archaeon]